MSVIGAEAKRRQSANAMHAGISKSLSRLIIYGMLCMMLVYVAVMLAITRYGAGFFTSVGANHANLNTVQHALARASHAAQQHGIQNKRQPIPSDHGDSRKEKEEAVADRILTAYVEHVDQDSWKQKPLPVRDTAHKDKLVQFRYPKMNSCSKFMEQFPVDDFPEGDEFLPWIHDAFPTEDGKFMQFVAQNKRRCKTGTSAEEVKILKEQQPQVALFQHVPVKRVDGGSRYRLSTHEEADEDGVATRFICRFKPSMQETLSVFNADYEYASFRKGHKRMFSPEGRDNKFIHTTQLIFQCPIPENLQERIRSGTSVQDDFATQFVDLIPIRTPPRFGAPAEFLKPYYSNEQQLSIYKTFFNATREWGTNHILPRIEDSGRWENIPICKPSLMQYEPQALDKVAPAKANQESKKPHHLVSCLWSSTGYSTRGNRFAINDGQRRLIEFITYYRIIGFDHFYLYDNSASAGNDLSLQSVADMFPEHVTIVNWPSKVCNNNPNNVDSVGERSSQYAAESSCRLRFGPHTNWIGQFDIDEYLVPMGEQETILPVLEKLDEEGKKIISFGSWRAWPRRRFIEEPVRMTGRENCGRDKDCFQLRIPANYTILQAYNCDRQKPGQKKSAMPAEKQIYRADYVQQHFLHYSTITKTSELNKRDLENAGFQWRRNAFPDPLSRFTDEITEGLMLHTKAVATQDTIEWETVCKPDYKGHGLCRLGTPFPDDEKDMKPNGDDGWAYNCYPNKKVDNFFVPQLEADLKEHVPEIAQRLAARNQR